MGKLRTVDITGNQYSFLKVLGISENYTQNRKWVCECVCGKICETTKPRLENGEAKSCGCMKSKLLSDANRVHGALSGGKNSPEYQSYIAMMHRCYDDKRAIEIHGENAILNVIEVARLQDLVMEQRQ